MSSIILTGDTSGTLTLSAPLVAGSNTVTLPAATGTISLLTQATAVSASGTSVDFTGIPSWAKRITVMLIGVSTSGTSAIIVQLGTGATPTYTTSGYVGYGTNAASASNSITSVTAGLPFSGISVAGNTYTSSNTITSYGTNNWMGVAVGSGGATIAGSGSGYGSGYIALGSVLTAVRITTVNGTDTFDAGTINIMYEG